MNEILNWLQGGDLRSDGMADQAAEFILENPQLLDELMDGICSEHDLIRGRTADALEKVARKEPNIFTRHIPELINIAKSDPVPMVKMHLAMLFGHLVPTGQSISDITNALLNLLKDESVFTKSWTITSLAIIGIKYPSRREMVHKNISKFAADESVAIRTRVRKALVVLEDENKRFPKGWIKSIHLSDL